MGLEKFALTAIRHSRCLDPTVCLIVSLPAAGNAKFTLALDRDSSMLSSLLPAASSRYSTLPIGSRMEISPDSSRIVRGLGETMAAGGAGLVIDYGGNRSFSNSFRVRKEKDDSPLTTRHSASTRLSTFLTNLGLRI